MYDLAWLMRARVIWSIVAIAGTASAEPSVTVGGYIETYWQAHFQNPENRITNLRGFDNKSRTFALSNVALDVKGEQGPIAARIVLQIGDTGTAYYSAADADPWKYVQAAYVTANAPSDFRIEAGLFPSPIGIETFPIKDNWHWSRSNLFVGLPFYHLGAMVGHPIGDTLWSAKVHVYNGWNTITDNNGYPSVAASAVYGADATSAQLLYFGGLERGDGAPEGDAWRHLFDASISHRATSTISLAGQLDAGFEPNDIGTSWWFAAQASVKLALAKTIYTAARVDYFREATDGASAIFWPVEWISSGTAALAYDPVANLSLRFELRHDHAADDAYYGGAVTIDPMTMTFIPNRRTQDTATLGATAWF